MAVSRLVDAMKGEGLFRSIEAVRKLGRELPLRLVMVGDGAARSWLEKLATETNAELGRPAVVLTGALLDPRAAYAAADIVVGMGSSALRGMAFAKPVIVVGEQGFSVPLIPETENFLYCKGLYGIGGGGPHNRPLVDNIRMLASDPDQLPPLGALSLKFVTQHFSLQVISEQVAAIFESAVTEQRPFLAIVADMVKSVALYLRYRRFRWRYVSAPAFQVVDRVEAVSQPGSASIDTFQPLARNLATHAAPMPLDPPVIRATRLGMLSIRMDEDSEPGNRPVAAK